MTEEERVAIVRRVQEITAEAGHVTPDMILEEAKPVDSPFHDWFEWDDTKAALAHRRNQARRLIGMVQVYIRTQTRTVSSVAYVRDPKAKANVQSYVSTESLKSDRELAVAALSYEMKRVRSMIERTRKVAAALGLEEEVESLLQTIVRIQDAVGAA